MFKDWEFLSNAFGHLVWWARQCFPMSYWLMVREDGVDKLLLWKMWFGVSFEEHTIVLPRQPVVLPVVPGEKSRGA